MLQSEVFVWQPQATAFFDIRDVDTDAKSYGSLSPRAVLANAEREGNKSTRMLVTQGMSVSLYCAFLWTG